MPLLTISPTTTSLVFTREVNTSAERLGLIVIVLYAGCKILVLCRGPGVTAGMLPLYLLWPGMDTKPFRRRSVRRDWPWLGRGVLGLCLGVVGGIALFWASPHIGRYAVGWLGVAVILTAVHLGFADILSGGLRRAGFPVRRLFRDPLRSRSLGEFWSGRWNLAYVELNRVLFLPPLRRLFGRGAVPAAFLLSGVFHELAISVPVQAGYGGPFGYFALHALLTALEPRLRVHRWPDWVARLWTWTAILAPLPVLFHTPFRDALVTPLFWSGA